MLRIIIICTVIVFTSCTNIEVPQTHRFIALNTTCSITVYNRKKVNLESVEKIVKDFESKISFHLPESKINKINSFAGEKSVEVDNELFYLIEKSIFFSELSKGYFDPTIGSLSKLWGIGSKNYLPDTREIDEILEKINYTKIEVESKNVLLEEQGMMLDLGGIAKGYISDIVKAHLKEIGVESAIINLGGNISLLGRKKGKLPWKVGIQNPKGIRGEELGVLSLVGKNVISSGSYERFFKKDGVVYHHILNPFTGYPKDGDIIASTIISEKGLDGDALSTITFGSSLEEIGRIKNEISFEGIFILKNNDVYITSGLRNKFVLRDNRYRLIEME